VDLVRLNRQDRLSEFIEGIELIDRVKRKVCSGFGQRFFDAASISFSIISNIYVKTSSKSDEVDDPAPNPTADKSPWFKIKEVRQSFARQKICTEMEAPICVSQARAYCRFKRE